MTNQSDLVRLFGIHPDTPRIGAYGQGASIAHDRGESQAIALTVELLDKDSKEPSGTWLALQLLPEDAMAVATAIAELASERGWEMPEILRSSFPSSGKSH